jgi:hypothetical protein
MLYGLGLTGLSSGKPNFISTLITAPPLNVACPGALGLVLLLLVVQAIADRVAGLRVAMAAPPPDADLQEALPRGIGFTRADLDVNRQGRLSDAQLENNKYFTVRQRSELPPLAASCSRIIALFAVGFFISVLIVMLGGTAIIPDVSRNAQFIVVILGGGAAGALVFTLLIESLWLLLRRALPARNRRTPAPLSPDFPVQVVEGKVRLHSGRNGRQGGYVMVVVIGNKRFIVSERAFQAFWNGAQYRVYFLKDRRQLKMLSAEFLGH